jgi:hypothetical protein
MKGTSLALALALSFGSTLLSPTADAAVVPALPGYDKAAADSPAIDVHYRNYRHCHWRYGERWCHGHRRHLGIYGGGPSIYLNFGHRHHNRHHWNRGRRW